MMRRLLIALLATAATLPAVATAQEPDRDERGVRVAERHDDGPRPDRLERIRPAAPERSFDGPRVRPDRPEPPAVDVNAAARVDRNRGGDRDWRGRDDAPAAPQAPPAAPAAGRDRGFAGSVMGWDADRVRQAQRDNRRTDDRRDGRDGVGDRDRNDGRGWDRGRDDGRRDRDRNENRGWDRGRDDNRWDRGRDDNRGWDRGRDWNRDGRWNDNRGGGWNGNRNWDRNWRSNSRYDWQRYRTSNRYAFRLPRYNAPYNWHYGYRRQSIGSYLFAGLFAQNYWIGNPWEYRLPPVEWPYRWVRYYDDALLVDTTTGQVVDVINDIFWY